MNIDAHMYVEEQRCDPVVAMRTPFYRYWFTLHDVYLMNIAEQAALLADIFTAFAKRALHSHKAIASADFGVQDLATGIRHAKFGDTNCAWEPSDIDLHGLAHRFVSDPSINVTSGSKLKFFVLVHPLHTLPQPIEEYAYQDA